MSRPRAFYYPLIAVVFFGLAISLMPASPALGSNLPFGVTLQQPNLSPNSLVRYSHTLLVGSGGTPTENGAALLAARDIISNSRPSAANPYLIKLEPGNYDLGNKSLILLPFTDLEGSGEGTTVISSTVGQANLQLTKATLNAGSNSEVRLLTVANFGANTFQAAVLIPPSANNARLSHVTATTTGSTDTNIGLYSDGENINITDTTINASGGSSNYGLFHNFGTMTVTNSTLNAFESSFNNIALLDHGDETRLVTINNSTLTAFVNHPNDEGFGVALWSDNASTIILNNSTLSAFVQGSSTQGFAAGILNNVGIINVKNSNLDAHAGKQGYGIYNNNFGEITVSNSSFNGGATTSYGINSVGANSAVRVANSQLSGFTAASNGVTLCAASVNGRTYTPLNAACK